MVSNCMTAMEMQLQGMFPLPHPFLHPFRLLMYGTPPAFPLSYISYESHVHHNMADRRHLVPLIIDTGTPPLVSGLGPRNTS